MKNSKKTTSVAKILILLLAISIISVWATKITYELYENSKIYDVKDINATFKIGDVVGLAADSETLNFGIIYPGGTSSKEVTLYHEYSEPLLIKFRYLGDIKYVLNPVEPFYLEPYTERKVGIVAIAKYNQLMNFTGVVRILYLKK